MLKTGLELNIMNSNFTSISSIEMYLKELARAVINIKSNKYIKKQKINTQSISRRIDRFNNDYFDKINNLEILSFMELIEKDKEYQSYLQEKRNWKERLLSLKISQQVYFALNDDKLVRNVYKDGIKNAKKKGILQKLHKDKEPNKGRNKRIVAEEDFSHSDDSLDYEISPIIEIHTNKSEIKKMEELFDILSKSKSASDINTRIRKNQGSLVKLKSKLEKDYKSVLLMMDYLGVV